MADEIGPCAPNHEEVTKAELLALMEPLWREQRTQASTTDLPDGTENLKLSNVAFGIVQRWIDCPAHTTVSLVVPQNSEFETLLARYVYHRLLQHFKNDILAIFCVAPPSQGQKGEAKSMICFFAQLFFDCFAAVPGGRCGNGPQMKRDLSYLVDAKWATETRVQGALRAFDWMIRELGPRAAFFIDGCPEFTDAMLGWNAELGEAAGLRDAFFDALQGCGCSTVKNRVWLNMYETPSARCEYQEFWCSPKYPEDKRSVEFDIVGPPSKERIFGELVVRGQPKEPYTVTFTRREDWTAAEEKPVMGVIKYGFRKVFSALR
ncbi:hypothetical protein F5Y15DRAFT_218069 [Xylariaceae sp. FL0016]|nr:hypothetical protein F5Y15DRAFT_218069 [Xylariaceae sp. FL0016]